MKIKELIKTEKEVEIELPAFWKNPEGNAFIGAMDELDNCIRFENTTSYKVIQHCEVWLKGNEIAVAHRDWIRITEEEFLTEHENFLRSLSLKPVLV